MNAYFESDSRHVGSVTVRSAGTISSALPELSGLTSTLVFDQKLQKSQTILWGHNDSGHATEVIAFNSQGEVLLRAHLPVASTDLEDIDTGPCPTRYPDNSDCLWLADTGDNQGKRYNVKLIVFPVPAVNQMAFNRQLNVEMSQITELVLTYPNTESPNVEAFALSHHGDHFWLFEKSDSSQIRIWQGKVNQSQVIEVGSIASDILSQNMGSTRSRRVTGADFAMDGKQLILRTYSAVYLFNLDSPYMLNELGLETPRLISQLSEKEPQGESVCFDRKNGRIWTASESKLNYPQRLHYSSIKNL